MKEMLKKQLIDAFDRDDEMSLMCSVDNLSQDEWEWKLYPSSWTIKETLYHIAECKIGYCKSGFNLWKDELPEFPNSIAAMDALSVTAHKHLLQCLEQCSESDLVAPLPIHSHGESAANFFYVMAVHDIWHGSQIQTIRRAFNNKIDS
jgi:uncharacterized damage-inducible protein DinB